MKDKIKNGWLRVWWNPPKATKLFFTSVKNVAEAKLIITTLERYDRAITKNKSKYAGYVKGGLEIWDDNVDADEDGNKWVDWYDEESGDGFDEYCKNNVVR